MNTVNYTGLGLNTDSLDGRLKQGELTFALNSLVESWDGDRISYQNETSNRLCFKFKDDLRPIGVFYIAHIDRVVYFLTNETTHQVAYSENGVCNYEVLFGSECLNFKLDKPIHQIVVKITNCSVQVFWPDDYNVNRYFDFEDLPWREEPNPNDDYHPIKIVGEVDCNKLAVQPNFAIPKAIIVSVEEGGQLKEGNYQFIVQYANAEGEGYSSFYNATDGISIHDPKKITQNYDLLTTKAIRVRVDNLDNTGLYDFFNLVVIETINAISTPRLVGTYPTTNGSYTTLYTGNTSTSIQFTPQQLFQKFQYYDIAGGVTYSDDRLIFYDLKEKIRTNYQSIWAKVEMNWVSYKIPYNEQEGYYKPENTNKYKGYMRDEVYPVEGVFILKNGKQSDRFPIVGREATAYDRETISNKDTNTTFGGKCDDIPQAKERWEVYNTATEEYSYPDTSDSCYKGKYKKGTFAFWESEERYPKNPLRWGPLAGQKIRHPKFPDELVSPRYSTVGNDEFIHPLGIEIDRESLILAIAQSSLTQEEKDAIVGFKIVRGDRTGNQSVVAKGMFYNVGKNTHNDQTFYYPNWPYNDLRKDPYYVTDKGIPDHSGYRPDKSIAGFGEHSLSRFTFYSPDTLFNQPFGVDNGYLKFESVEYGQSKGHFVPVENNAEYVFLSPSINRACVGIAAAGGFTLAAGTFGWPTFSVDRIIPTFVGAREMFEKLAPLTNFGYVHTSVGEYNKSYPIPNEGFKNRGIDYGRYLLAGNYRVEDGNIINNTLRESSVYLHTSEDFKFTHDYDNGIPRDKSRYTISSFDGSTELLEDFLSRVQADNTLITDDDLRAGIGIQQTLDDIGEVWTFTIGSLNGDKPNLGDVYYIADWDITVQSCSGQILIGVKTGNAGPPPSTGTLTLKSKESPDSNPAQTITYTAITPQAAVENPDDVIADVRAELANIITIEDYENALNGGGYIVAAAYAIQSAYFKSISNSTLTPETFRYTDISAYYGSIKHYLPAQWGAIHSYEVVDTGFYQNVNDEAYDTVFGGDTFINRFALKRKLQLTENTTVGRPNKADINYKKIGALGYLMYWISTEPEDFKLDIQEYIDKIIKVVNKSPGVDSGGSTLEKIWTVIKGIISGGGANVAPIMGALINIFNKIYLKLGKANINLDNAQVDGYIERGLMYLYSYGIPTFFVESQVNVDYRQAINDTWGEFYPHVSAGVPDKWLQETTVPIVQDNNYSYNQSFSKQNRENYYTYLPEDFDPDKLCNSDFQNRAIWSDKTNLNETLNNWLIYRPVAKYDFPKTFGKLTSLDGIQNKIVLARFENQTQLYNAVTTLDSSSQRVFLGDDRLFSAPPLDITHTDTGSMGSQNKFISKNERGVVFVDTKRGQVIILRGQTPELLSDKKMARWFKENLPFNITKRFPEINTDNHFNGVGLHGIYDEYYQRLILTKKDYEPKEGVTYSNGKFYRGDRLVTFDSDAFYDRSWTISYNFLIEGWVSFHSYTPNIYVPNTRYFAAIQNGEVWNHNQTFDSYTTYFGQSYPYILEYPFAYEGESQIVQSVSDSCISRRYTSLNTFVEPDELLFYNKMIIFNGSQNTGLLNLVEKPRKNPYAYLKYPKYNSDSKDILMSKKDGVVRTNGFWDVVKDKSVPMWTEDDLITRQLNQSNMNYTQMNYKKSLMRGKDMKVRMILDDKHDFKIISEYTLTETTSSKI